MWWLQIMLPRLAPYKYLGMEAFAGELTLG